MAREVVCNSCNNQLSRTLSRWPCTARKPVFDIAVQVVEQGTASLQNLPVRKPSLPRCQYFLREYSNLLRQCRSKTLQRRSQVNMTSLSVDVECAEIGFGIAQQFQTPTYTCSVAAFFRCRKAYIMEIFAMVQSDG